MEAHAAVRANTQSCAWSVFKAPPAPALPSWHVTPGTQGWGAQQEQVTAASSPEYPKQGWGNGFIFPFLTLNCISGLH